MDLARAPSTPVKRSEVSGRDLNCFQFVFGHVLDLTFGLFVMFCHLKMFTVASAVQDVSQLQMSGFSIGTVSHFTVLVKAVDHK